MVEPRIVIPAVVGSSPISHPIKKFCSVRLSVRTQDFHSCKTGSTPVPSTKFMG